ncbi:hypothetical protein P43SY_003163 [Pythium insidiosum]|uniref:Uncharacterized protein n=1 Tax=Pythium insidiosum TaxID=114742 RepID=A0AAD5Q9B7_PYTIN|nr:hypothetical protein P43SY_003163 [Pythium insidiosum]KAJ0400559.1 hypothetical protein ATCC90586_007302 [Pythium insidiosum]
MVMTTTKSLLTVAVAATVMTTVNAHGQMTMPKAQFGGGDPTSFVTTISSSKLQAPSGMSFTTSPEANTKAFTAAIKASSFKTLRDFIEQNSQPGECGKSVVGAPQPLPDMVEWSHGSGEGFTPSHEGPCEVWCDDKQVFHDDNCARNYPQAPARLPYEKAKCAGASKLTIYWLALHSSEWQVYKNCAALQGGSGPAPGPAPSSAPAPGPAPSSAPRPSTSPSPSRAPSPGGDDEDCDDDLPIAGDDDCDDLPEPDCDDDLPVKGDDIGGESNYDKFKQGINFRSIEDGEGEDAPGQVVPEDY